MSWPRKSFSRNRTHFAEYANSVVHRISVMYVEEVNMQEKAESNSQSVPGTLKIHCVERELHTNNNKLTFFLTSQEQRFEHEPMHTLTFSSDGLHDADSKGEDMAQA